jgi:hypothetical protein
MYVFRWKTCIPAAAFAVAMAINAPPVWAAADVHKFMELEGNAIDETAIGSPGDSLPDDWGRGDNISSSG